MDAEKLILLIHENPALYALDRQDYKDSKKKDNIWDNIARKLGVTTDVNKDGCLEWKDFNLARENICKLNGWKPGTDKYMATQNLFMEMWRNLQDCADENYDGKVTEEEWVRMWQGYQRSSEEKEEDKVPTWLENYIEYKFNLYDRCGDEEIDIEEFEYVLSGFDIPAKNARACFVMFTENKQRKVTRAYFRQLALEYFRSDDANSLGNFINGKLDFS